MELDVSSGARRAAQRRSASVSRGVLRRLDMRMLLHGNLLRSSLLGSFPSSRQQRYQQSPPLSSCSHSHSPSSPSTVAIRDQYSAPTHQPTQQHHTHPWVADGSCRPPRAPGMTITPRGPSATASNSSLSHCSSSGSVGPL